MLRYRLLEASPDDGGAGGGGGGGGEGAPNPADQEKEARKQGWAPREQWRGNPAAWVDAGEFLKRAETFVPFLKRERQQLRTELGARDQQIAGLQQQLAAQGEQLSAIRQFNEEMAADRASRRKREINSEMEQAREGNNHTRYAELSAELNEITTKERQQRSGGGNSGGGNGNGNNSGGNAAPNGGGNNGGGNNAPPQIQPWVKNFIDDNSEFFQDPRKVAFFNTEMTLRRQQGDSRVGDSDGTALLNEALESVNSMLGGNPRRRAASKTEGSTPPGDGGPGGSGATGGKTYADLPVDARQQCDKQAERFVGDGKLFKDKESWRRHYVAEYFGPSASAMSRTVGEDR